MIFQNTLFLPAFIDIYPFIRNLMIHRRYKGAVVERNQITLLPVKPRKRFVLDLFKRKTKQSFTC